MPWVAKLWSMHTDGMCRLLGVRVHGTCSVCWLVYAGAWCRLVYAGARWCVLVYAGVCWTSSAAPAFPTVDRKGGQGSSAGKGGADGGDDDDDDDDDKEEEEEECCTHVHEKRRPVPGLPYACGHVSMGMSRRHEGRRPGSRREA